MWLARGSVMPGCLFHARPLVRRWVRKRVCWISSFSSQRGLDKWDLGYVVFWVMIVA